MSCVFKAKNKIDFLWLAVGLEPFPTALHPEKWHLLESRIWNCILRTVWFLIFKYQSCLLIRETMYKMIWLVDQPCVFFVLAVGWRFMEGISLNLKCFACVCRCVRMRRTPYQIKCFFGGGKYIFKWFKEMLKYLLVFRRNIKRDSPLIHLTLTKWGCASFTILLLAQCVMNLYSEDQNSLRKLRPFPELHKYNVEGVNGRSPLM